MQILHYASLPSTNTFVAEHAATMASGTLVAADAQTAGRGQRGNHWEATPGLNLTFTLLHRPENFPAREQFYLSEAVSVAICEAIEQATGVPCQVKWPNDIYADGRKLCGILISHALQGSLIEHTIIGAGINVNQTEFLSDAPNPVSLAQLTGRTFELEPLLKRVAAGIEAELRFADGYEALHKRYMSRLWRGDGAPYPYYDVQSGERFNASVYAIEPLGHLVLRQHPDGRLRRYAFKEVIFL